MPERFWQKVELGPDCWEWRASKLRDGYGNFWLDGRVRLAHRVAYELVREPIPEGLVIDHLCRNRGCVNPAHMEAVTPAVNNSVERAHLVNRTKTHCKHGHEFTPENTGRFGGRRYCRECRRRWSKERRATSKYSAE